MREGKQISKVRAIQRKKMAFETGNRNRSNNTVISVEYEPTHKRRGCSNSRWNTDMGRERQTLADGKVLGFHSIFKEKNVDDR